MATFHFHDPCSQIQGEFTKLQKLLWKAQFKEYKWDGEVPAFRGTLGLLKLSSSGIVGTGLKQGYGPHLGEGTLSLSMVAGRDQGSQ